MAVCREGAGDYRSYELGPMRFGDLTTTEITTEWQEGGRRIGIRKSGTSIQARRHGPVNATNTFELWALGVSWRRR